MVHIINNNDKLVREVKLISKLRVTKTSLKKILNDDIHNTNQLIIFDAVNRTHQIVIHMYQFMRLYILNKYHKKQNIPIITLDFIIIVFKTLVKTSKSGNTPKGANLILFKSLKLFYETDYKILGYKKKIDGVNLSHIFGYIKTDILTNIENNVKMHFISYVKRFVNSSFRENNNKLLEKAVWGKKISLRKELNKDLYDIKEDLIKNTLTSNPKYHNWIKKHRPNIFPSKFKDSYEFDIKHSPQKYIKNMIYMCIELEKINGKSYQFFPIRNNISPKYIPIDTAIIVDLFIKKDKREYLDNVGINKKKLWNILLNTSDSVFKQSKFSFDNLIYTDGLAVSVQLINNSQIEFENIKKENRKINEW
jgi:hypothetical protein